MFRHKNSTGRITLVVFVFVMVMALTSAPQILAQEGGDTEFRISPSYWLDDPAMTEAVAAPPNMAIVRQSPSYYLDDPTLTEAVAAAPGAAIVRQSPSYYLDDPAMTEAVAAVPGIAIVRRSPSYYLDDERVIDPMAAEALAFVETGEELLAAGNRQLAEQYFNQVLSEGDIATADAILAPRFARIDRSRTGVELGRIGTEFLASFYQLAFPDVTYTIDALAVEGEYVAVCWTAEGVVGSYPLAANTGEPVTWTGMSFLRVNDGQIEEELTNLESMAMVLHINEDLRLSPSYIR